MRRPDYGYDAPYALITFAVLDHAARRTVVFDGYADRLPTISKGVFATALGHTSHPDCRIIVTNRGCRVSVRHRLFRGTFKSWDALCEEAAAFATTVGKERLINVSVSQGDTGHEGVIFVWYWE
jgi:hypothetical protein